VDAYEVKNQELIAENADLRALLRSMQVGSWLVTYYLKFLLADVYECHLCVSFAHVSLILLGVILDFLATFVLITSGQCILLS